MLIQITNRCHMGCKHCMQCSNAKGKHMSEDTFERVLTLVNEAQPLIVNITGGEPTEHPLWKQFAKELLNVKSVKIMTIITNGAWIEDDKTRIDMAKLIRENKGNVKVQVYSNPKYYKDHEWTVAHEAQYKSIGCITDFDSPIFMQDLGRARKNCKEEVADSDHVPSCINSHLIALQSSSLHQFCMMSAQAGKFCRPLIDPEGYIHMSESCRCPSVAHVDDGVAEAFFKMRQSRPCRSCQLYKNFATRFPREMEMLK